MMKETTLDDNMALSAHARIYATMRTAYGDCCDGVWADILDRSKSIWFAIFQQSRLCDRCTRNLAYALTRYAVELSDAAGGRYRIGVKEG